MNAFRTVSYLFLLFAGLVLIRYAWSRFVLKNQDITIFQAVGDTQQLIIAQGQAANEKLGKILGVNTTSEGIGGYVREDLPKEVQQRLEQSKVVQQVKGEVAAIVSDTVQKAKDMPAVELKKVETGVKQEICRQLLKDEIASVSGEKP